MPDEVPIAATGAEPTLSLCPNCKALMEGEAKVCRACGLPTDWKRKQESEEEKKRVKKAGDQAYAMMLLSFCLVPFFLMRYLPFVAIAGAVGFLLVLVSVPTWAIRWWDRFGKIESTSAEYAKAKKTVLLIGVLTASLTLVLFVLQVYRTASTFKM
ncbi:MAG TPA: hypothetical protein VF392_01130 [Terracidiphilus sp.]